MIMNHAVLNWIRDGKLTNNFSFARNERKSENFTGFSTRYSGPTLPQACEMYHANVHPSTNGEHVYGERTTREKNPVHYYVWSVFIFSTDDS